MGRTRGLSDACTAMNLAASSLAWFLFHLLREIRVIPMQGTAAIAGVPALAQGCVSVRKRSWAGGRRVEVTMIAGHVVPGVRLVPAQGIGVGQVGVDADARLEEVDLLLQLDRAGQAQPGAHLLGQPEREGALALGVSAGV